MGSGSDRALSFLWRTAANTACKAVQALPDGLARQEKPGNSIMKIRQQFSCERDDITPVMAEFRS